MESLNKEQLKKDFDLFFWAAMAAVCHCVDPKTGTMRQNCDCNEIQRIDDSKKLLITEYKKLIKRYDLQ